MRVINNCPNNKTIEKGSLVCVNPVYKDINTDFYAIYFNHRIYIGNVTFNQDHNKFILNIDNHYYFPSDYVNNHWKILGRVYTSSNEPD